MNKWLSFAAVLSLAPLGAAYGACEPAGCYVRDATTVLAIGEFELCDSSRFDGILLFSVPDAEVAEVSMRGRLSSDPTSQWSIALSRPSGNRVQVNVGLSEDQGSFVDLGGATIRIVTTSHPEGISGTIDLGQAIKGTTWATAKRLYQ